MGPYLSSLPSRELPVLLNWSDQDKELLIGTTLESLTTEESAEKVFQREIVPRMLATPELFPAPYNTLKQFLRVAGLVQSRAFHLEAQNWVTGSHQVCGVHIQGI